jgi:hypothetical protein
MVASFNRIYRVNPKPHKSSCSPFCSNILKILVALGWIGLSGLAWNGSGAWRHDNQRVCIPFGYGW